MRQGAPPSCQYSEAAVSLAIAKPCLAASGSHHATWRYSGEVRADCYQQPERHHTDLAVAPPGTVRPEQEVPEGIIAATYPHPIRTGTPYEEEHHHRNACADHDDEEDGTDWHECSLSILTCGTSAEPRVYRRYERVEHQRQR